MADLDANTGFAGGVSGGLSNLARAVGGSRMAYQQARYSEGNMLSRMAHAAAMSRAADAQAALHGAQTDEVNTKTGILQARPDDYEEQVAAGAGTDVPMVHAIRQMVQTGQAPQVPMGPEAPDGSMGVGSQQFDPAVKSLVMRKMQELYPILGNAGDLNPEQMAQARQRDRTSALSDAIIAGQANRNTVGGAQAASEGKPLFATEGSTGAVLDPYAGTLDTSNPLAQGNIGLIGNKSKAEVALANDRNASAGQHGASTAKIRAEIADMQGAPGVPGSPGIKVPTGYQLDPSNPGGLMAIPGGPADKTGGPGGLDSRSALMFSRVSAAANGATAGLKNLTELPVTASTGWLGTAKPGHTLFTAPLTALAQKLTPEEVQTTNVMMTGITRQLGTIETSGLTVTDHFMDSMNAIKISEGDTNFNKLRKLAEIRQLVETGLEPNLSNPKLPAEQKQLVRNLISQVQQVVPYTQHDLTELSKTKNPGTTSLADYSKKLGLGAGAPRTAAPGQPGQTPSAPIAPAGAPKTVSFHDLK